MRGLATSHLRPGHPDLLDLPWHLPLDRWEGHTPRLESLPRGEARHPVVFVDYDGRAYALKAMGEGQAEHEYQLLREMEDRQLPVVAPVGHVTAVTDDGPQSVLVTRYLAYSLPYHSLFLRSDLSRYRDHLLDAMAGLLVQLHLAGVWWGDCSLFNTLFLRDAGTLQAVLVDAETSRVKDRLDPGERAADLDLMEENVAGGLLDLVAMGALPEDYPAWDLAADIRQRYDRLWHEVSRVEEVRPEERYRITERVRALNALGFSVGEIALERREPTSDDDGGRDRLRLRVVVTDRSFNRRLLHSLTGLEVQEQQAQQMVNEIQELRATLGHLRDRSVSLGAAAFHWLESLYTPSVRALRAAGGEVEPPERYCQLLEHKWLLSEVAGRDVGHEAALADLLARLAPEAPDAEPAAPPERDGDRG
ncbi:MAG: DUF4032 domain-containing protein [Myxococcales bacterium]|nr:DUF4032 domain-containing protein [Myxococcales bacterium]MCB9734887.1 DUF4032 domain-containing protein [Deltaproteobacteria bacterium]